MVHGLYTVTSLLRSLLRLSNSDLISQVTISVGLKNIEKYRKKLGLFRMAVISGGLYYQG